MLQEIANKIKNLKDEYLKEGRIVFQQGCKEIFDKYPINSFSWLQYTPYFNDGDECTFGVIAEDYGLSINDLNFDDVPHIKKKDGKIYQQKYCSQTGKYVDEEVTELSVDGLPDNWMDWYNDCCHDISKFIYSFEYDFLKNLFGDHVKVTINCDGTTSTSDYNHD